MRSSPPADFRRILPPSLLTSARHTRLQQGAYLFHQRDPVRAVYFVESGQIALRRPLPDGNFVVTQVAGPGDSFAEAALFAENHHCDAIGMMQSQVLEVPKQSMLDLFDRDHSVALAWTRHLSWQLQDLRQRIEIRDIRPARNRVLAWLALHDRSEIVLDRPLKDLARELGLTHEVFYRTLAALERDGSIQRRKGMIVRMRSQI